MQSPVSVFTAEGPANILVMPGLHSANISFKLMQQLGGGSVIGPMILNAEFPFQIIPMSASVSDLVNAAALAAYESLAGHDWIELSQDFNDANQSRTICSLLSAVARISSGFFLALKFCASCGPIPTPETFR